MQIPTYVKPALWGAVAGAVIMSIVGFRTLGWTTAGSAERAATERASVAVVTAMVPFCVAKAQQDGDATKLVKLRAEESSYARSQLVQAAGWATMPGTSAADDGLARACAETLRQAKSS
ncbi:MAG: hypothetical protein U1E53_13840 [Dongiaceae bacterium]